MNEKFECLGIKECEEKLKTNQVNGLSQEEAENHSGKGNPPVHVHRRPRHHGQGEDRSKVLERGRQAEGQPAFPRKREGLRCARHGSYEQVCRSCFGSGRYR